MNNHIVEFVDSYYKPIIDSETELRKQGYSFTLFIDTHDIIKTIKGINTYYNPHFQRKDFNQQETTVYNLIMGGWIKEVQLLPPHQGEFIDKLEKNFGIDNSIDAEEFINDLNAEKNLKKIQIGDIEYNNQETENFVANSINNSVRYFNLIYTIYKHNWKSRFRSIINGKSLIINNYNNEDLLDLVKTSEFKLIKKSIDSDPVRAKDKNFAKNFNDALALSYLLYECRNNDKRIPILFDSTGTFRRIIKNANLKDEFRYYNDILEEFLPIIRDSNYFIFKAIFDFPTNKLSKIKKLLPNYYKERHTDVESGASILFYSGIKKYNKNYESVVTKYIEKNNGEFIEYLMNKFFQSIWLPCFANTETKEIIKDYVEDQSQSIRYFKKRNNEKIFIDSFVSKYRLVKRESDDFNNLAIIWRDLYQMRESNDFKRLIKHSSRELFVFLYYGLFRFSLPYFLDNVYAIKEYEEELNSITLENGLISDDEDFQQISIDSIITSLFSGLMKQNQNDLTIGISILWTLEKYQHIDTIFSPFERDGNYPHFAYALLHCACIIKKSSLIIDIGRVFNIFNCVKEKIKKPNYKIQICVSYIFYLIWDKKHVQGTFSKNKNHPNIAVDENLSKAIENIDLAINYFDSINYDFKKDLQIVLYLYALNMKIYMTIEGVPCESRFRELDEIVNSFMTYKSTYQDFWQGRFDDTLARYFLRKAFYELINGTQKDYIRYREKSRYYINEAIKNSFQDLIKKEHFEELLCGIEKEKIKDLKDRLKVTPSNTGS